MPKKIKIAIADDNEKLRASVKAQLNRFGFDVIIDVSDGKELIDQLEDSPSLPHVCIIDVNMPNMNGFEAAHTIKSKWETIKIIGFSFDEINERKMLQKGADVFLLKSGEPEALFRTIVELGNSNRK